MWIFEDSLGRLLVSLTFRRDRGRPGRRSHPALLREDELNDHLRRDIGLPGPDPDLRHPRLWNLIRP